VRPREPLDGRVAVVVDDGIATGSTARAACQIARAAGAARVVLAVPVAPPGWHARIGADAGELARVGTPRGFCATGQFYAEFPQVSDEEVIACLERAAVPPSPAPAGTVRAAAAADPRREQDVRPEAGAVRLAGYLTVPEDAPRDRGLRPRQRQQPAQPPQPACGRRAERGRAGPLPLPGASVSAKDCQPPGRQHRRL
jgi:putative phosphoribosyl transferase